MPLMARSSLTRRWSRLEATASGQSSHYAEGRYQQDKRWESSDASEPTSVVVIDNVPSQANRLEAALEATADKIGAPRLVLDLTGEDFAHLPPHLPRSLSSLRWPHRNADAYRTPRR